jgi:starch synthase
MTAIKVLAVASEVFPLVKTGGLADVVGALPLAFRRGRVEMMTLVPGYPAVMRAIRSADKIRSADTVCAIEDLFGGQARVLRSEVAGLDLMVVDAPHLYDRPGNPYMGPDGGDWPDNAFRFGALSWIAMRIGAGEVAGYSPDIIHGHDWQAGLTMAYLAYQDKRRPATILTVHNLAFQGQFSADLLERLRLPAHAFTIDGVESYGKIGFLKAGLQFADRITTVSPTYAREIQTESYGCGLDGLLRLRSGVLTGIRNGIDIDVWNPETDARIVSRYGRTTLSARAPNKAALQRRFGLVEGADRLLFALIGRMAWQKGLDLLADATPTLIARGAQLAVLGSGDPELEQRLTALAHANPGQVGCILGYDEDLAHLIQAGADAVLVPSRFEPCGLTQLCAMRYGAIPVVSKVGGLADTVVDLEQTSAGGANGIQFAPVTREALQAALLRAIDLWSDRKGWQALQSNAMQTDVSWNEPANQFLHIYGGLLAPKN